MMDMRHVMYRCFSFFFIPCVVLLDRSHFQQSQTSRKKSDRAKKTSCLSCIILTSKVHSRVLYRNAYIIFKCTHACIYTCSLAVNGENLRLVDLFPPHVEICWLVLSRLSNLHLRIIEPNSLEQMAQIHRNWRWQAEKLAKWEAQEAE